MVPATVAPSVGVVMAMVGAMASTPVTVTLAVAVLPAASCAVTVSTFVPSWRRSAERGVGVVPLAVPLPPRLLAHVTWVTPTLSDAVPPRVKGVLLVLYVDAVVGAVMAMAGAMASTPVTVTLAVAVLPAASCAVTVSTFVPSWRAIPLAVQLVVPLAVPLPPRLLAHVTWATPTLSDAVRPCVRGELLGLYVDAVVGVVMAMVGGVVSLKTVTLTADDVAVLPAASRATADRVWEPLPASVVFQEMA